jgi:hypothetical protein
MHYNIFSLHRTLYFFIPTQHWTLDFSRVPTVRYPMLKFATPLKGLPVAVYGSDMCVSVYAAHVFIQYTSAVGNIFSSYGILKYKKFKLLFCIRCSYSIYLAPYGKKNFILSTRRHRFK